MEIVVNGEARGVAGERTVLELLADLGLDPTRLAIEFDRQILPKALWAETSLHEGARLEIVQFVGGG